MLRTALQDVYHYIYDNDRYLGKIDRGDAGVPEDGEIEPGWLEVDRILDVREEEVTEVVDEHPPPVIIGTCVYIYIYIHIFIYLFIYVRLCI
jgi:hypothetical protein